MARILEGIRVVDTTEGPAGGLATMVMADFGAEVIKVEPPGGDRFRSMASAPMWLRGKKSVVLDLAAPEDLDKLKVIISTADVFLTNQLPEASKALGLVESSLRSKQPALIYARMTGFGSIGPYRNYPAYEPVVMAKLGRMLQFQGLTDREGPSYAALQIATHACAMASVSGIVAALLSRSKSGIGNVLDTSLLRSMLAYEMGGMLWQDLGDQGKIEVPPSPGSAPKPMPNINYHPFQASDGSWVQLGNLLPHLLENFLKMSGLTKFIQGPKHEGLPIGWDEKDGETFRNTMLAHMQKKSSREWMGQFIEDGGVAAHPYLTTQEALDDPDLVKNGHVANVHGMRQLGLLGTFTRSPGQINRAPNLDADGDEDFARRPQEKGIDLAGKKLTAPLEGITVLEFGAIIAAPLAGSCLADMGARVIKIEPQGGDPFRAIGGGFGAIRVNGGKESIILDLKKSDAQKIAHELVTRADILIHNFRPGVAERLGIGFEDVIRLNPKLVYLQSNGYGPNGPGALRPSTHPIPGAALGGALWQAGGKPSHKLEGPEKLREISRRLFQANEVNPDPNTAVVILATALLGLFWAQKTGEGQQIFVDMFGANAYANWDDFLDYKGKEPRKPLDAELYGLGALHRLYPAKEGWIYFQLETQIEWEMFCKLVESKLNDDPQFSSVENRNKNDRALSEELKTLFAQKSSKEWESSLANKGIGCVQADASLPPNFWLKNDHAKANSLTAQVHHPRWKEHARPGPLIDFSQGTTELKGSPARGQHSNALLDELGYDAASIEKLRDLGVIA